MRSLPSSVNVMAVRALDMLAVTTFALAAIGCGRGPFWELGEPEIRRCSAVDFLFVIDNSESMEDHQQNLRASFEPFIDGIRRSLDDVDDYHVGVVTTDRYRDNADGCKELGALVTSTNGLGAQRIPCGPFAEGHRYMTEQDDLAEAFNCTANVGTEGSRDEKPMDAMRRAIVPSSGRWYQECNEGFVRDDALLVNVIITDESDGEYDPGNPRPGSTPDDWFDTIATVKGTESNAVVVSLLNGVTPECPVTAPAFDGTNIADFTNRFTYGFVGGICEQDYGALFERAVDEIDEACSAYELTP